MAFAEGTATPCPLLLTEAQVSGFNCVAGYMGTKASIPINIIYITSC